MGEYYIRASSKNKTVCFKTQNAGLVKYLEKDFFPRESIPSYSCKVLCEYNPPAQSIRSNSKKSEIVGKSRIYGISEDLYYPDVVYKLIMDLAALHGLSGNALIHSACVGNSKECGLIVGDAGSGKSSLMFLISLLTSSSIISNDRTILDLKNGKVLGGTTDIDLRPITLELLKQLSKMYPDVLDISKLRTFEKRIKKKKRIDRKILKYEVSPSDLQTLNLELNDASSKLKYVLFTFCYPGTSKLYELPKSDGQNRLLYFISQYYRGDGRYFVTLKEPMPPTITDYSIIKWHADLLAGLEGVKFYVGFGNPIGIAEKISQRKTDGVLTSSEHKFNDDGIFVLTKSLLGKGIRNPLEAVFELERNGFYLSNAFLDIKNNDIIDLRYPSFLDRPGYSPLVFSSDGRILIGVFRDKMINQWPFISTYSNQEILSFGKSQLRYVNQDYKRFVKLFRAPGGLEYKVELPDTYFEITYLFSLLRGNFTINNEILPPLENEELLKNRGKFIAGLSEKEVLKMGEYS
ncbi:MAG: hypothetical protein QXS93_04580 [Candidatus Micrarchaeia archaeon]